MIHDLIIIGGGPAGCAAAVYAARKRLKTLFITKDFESQSVVSEQIFNWIGTVSLSGKELGENFKKHVLANVGDSLEVKERELISKIEKNGENFDIFIGEEISPRQLNTEQSSNEKEQDNGRGKYQAKAVLIATGSRRRKLEAKGADIFEHKGLTYCASCDGPIFADQDVVVIGGGNAGFESAAQLLAYCKSVTLLHRSDSFKADEITVEKVLANPKMKAYKNVEILEVTGDKFVDGIIFKDKITGEQTDLKVTGIFVETGQLPNTDLVKDLVELDGIKKIKVDPMNQRSSVAGIWAAGDCTNGLYHQNNIAAGDAIKTLSHIYIYFIIK